MSSLLPCAHAQGVKQSFVVVGTKIARSLVLGIYVICKLNQSIDIGGKTGLYALRIAQKGLLVLQIVHFLFSMPVVYRPHPLHRQMLMRLRMLKLSVGKGRQVIKQL